MRKSFFVFIFSFLVMFLFCQKTSKDLLEIGMFPQKDLDKLQDERGGFLPPFFDRWNKFYALLSDEVEVNQYNSKFDYLITKRMKGVFWSSGVFSNMFLTPAYSNVVFSLGNGEKFNIYLLKKSIHGNNVFGKLWVTNFTPKGQYSGSLVNDYEKNTFIPLSQQQLFEYIEKNGKDLSLSIKNGAILYRGQTWEEIGSEIIWGHKRYADWLAIDKDGLAYDIDKIFDLTGKKIKDISIVMEDPMKRKRFFTTVAHDYEGNIYYFNRNKISYLGRDWGYDFLTQSTVGSGELKISTLTAGTKITIQEKTKQKESMNGLTTNWYKVKASDLIIGWVHGSVLSIKPEDDKKLLVYDSPALQVRGLKE
jgi:hypothetical protein